MAPGRPTRCQSQPPHLSRGVRSHASVQVRQRLSYVRRKYERARSKGAILVDTGSESGVGLAPQKWREWKAAHTNQPARLILGYMVQPGLIVREQSLGG